MDSQATLTPSEKSGALTDSIRSVSKPEATTISLVSSSIAVLRTPDGVKCGIDNICPVRR